MFSLGAALHAAADMTWALCGSRPRVSAKLGPQTAAAASTGALSRAHAEPVHSHEAARGARALLVPTGPDATTKAPDCATAMTSCALTAVDSATLCQDLQGLRVKELRQRARLLGISEHVIDEAENLEQHPKTALASLVVARLKELGGIDSLVQLEVATSIHSARDTCSADTGSPSFRGSLGKSRSEPSGAGDWQIQLAGHSRGDEGADDDMCMFESLDNIHLGTEIVAQTDLVNEAPMQNEDGPHCDERDHGSIVTSAEIIASVPEAPARTRAKAGGRNRARGSWACASRDRSRDGTLEPAPLAGSLQHRSSSGLARWNDAGENPREEQVLSSIVPALAWRGGVRTGRTHTVRNQCRGARSG